MRTFLVAYCGILVALAAAFPSNVNNDNDDAVSTKTETDKLQLKDYVMDLPGLEDLTDKQLEKAVTRTLVRVRRGRRRRCRQQQGYGHGGGGYGGGHGGGYGGIILLIT